MRRQRSLLLPVSTDAVPEGLAEGSPRERQFKGHSTHGSTKRAALMLTAVASLGCVSYSYLLPRLTSAEGDAGHDATAALAANAAAAIAPGLFGDDATLKKPVYPAVEPSAGLKRPDKRWHSPAMAHAAFDGARESRSMDDASILRRPGPPPPQRQVRLVDAIRPPPPFALNPNEDGELGRRGGLGTSSKLLEALSVEPYVADGGADALGSREANLANWLPVLGKQAVVDGLPAAAASHVHLWLDGEEGVETDESGMVIRWRDRGHFQHDFVPMPAKSVKLALRRLSDQLEDYQDRQRAAPGALDSLNLEDVSGPHVVLPASSSEGSGPRRPAVAFPCGLIGEDVTLSNGMTAFFVLSPALSGGDENAPGQRFFGTYPEGQFRFVDGRPSLRVRRGDALGPAVPSAGNDAVLIAYRFNHNVQISVNGGEWEVARFDNGAEAAQKPVFSAGVPVLLGSSAANACGFVGWIGEVLLLDKALDDAGAAEVLQYLADKWEVGTAAAHKAGKSADPSVSVSVAASSKSVEPMVDLPAMQQKQRDADTAVAAEKARKIQQASSAEKVANKAARAAHASSSSAEPPMLIPMGEKQRRRDTEVVDGAAVFAAEAHANVKAAVKSAPAKSKSKAAAGRGAAAAPPAKPAQRKAGAASALGRQQADARAAATAADVYARAAKAAAADRQTGQLHSGGGGSGGGSSCVLEGRVEQWEPPASADVKSRYQWRDARKAAMDKIRGFDRGGDVLRSMIHEEVVRLDVLRHELFCG